MEQQPEATAAAPAPVARKIQVLNVINAVGGGVNFVCWVFIAGFAFIVFCVKTAPPEVRQESVHYFRNGSTARDVEYTANQR